MFMPISHLDLLLHLGLVLGFWVLFQVLPRWLPLRAALLWPGTVAHELAHWVVGWALFARPCSLSVLPQSAPGGRFVLGSVGFKRARWWNLLPIAVAPLVILAPAGLAVLVHLCAPSPTFVAKLCWAFVVFELWMACWPSPEDWALARVTLWVLLGLGVLVGVVWLFLGGAHG